MDLSLVVAVSQEGRRPLHYAVTAFTTNLSQGVSDLSTLKYLVEDKQVNPNAADNVRRSVYRQRIAAIIYTDLFFFH